MGNCFPKPINNLPSATKFSSSPVTRGGGGDSGHVKNQQNVSTGSGNRAKGPVIPEEKHGDRGGPEAAAAGGEVDGGVLDTVPASGRIVTPDLKMFTFAELWSATRKFRPDTMLGEGGFGRVFKGWVDPKTYAPSRVGVGIPVAVKKSSPDSPQGLKEWQAEVKFLGKFSHPNLVRLLGYCWEDREFLLVYEYMQKGSLENHLFRNGAETLTWDTRIKIAIGAAQGLAFLHNTEKTVIYRDFKAANILLDGEYNAKLSDFGLAKLGPANGESHVSTGVVGTYGYAAPEYVATGHLYVKSDVYGFGVVLLEIITGMRVLDTNRPSTQHNLVDFAKPSLADKRKLRKIIDPRLEHDFPSKGAIKAAELILTCLEPDPKNRPSMDQVLESLEVIRAIETKPREPRHGNGYEAGQHHQHRPANHRQHSYHPSPVNSRQGGGARADRLSPHRSY